MTCLLPRSTLFQLYRDGKCIYPCPSGVRLTSSLQNILSKSLNAFPHNQCRSNGRRNESCRYGYHKPSERILAEHKDRTNDLLFSRRKPFENRVGKGENAVIHHFLLFSQCFLPFPIQISIFQSHLFCRLQVLPVWTSLKICRLVKS